ncbi:MAG: carbamoyltransferase HypF [Desulfobacterales bacterium]
MLNGRLHTGTAKALEIRGIVQGVGFRPFIYQLARHYGLTGMVANTATGVQIHVEGQGGDVDGFIADIRSHAPPLSHITEVFEAQAAFEGFGEFSISPSRSGQLRTTLISPDVSICQDCYKELFDPHDRRYGYPFINCTNCGPRYTIVDDIPYDRANTSMKHFPMCPECRAEYEDPQSRRFHAQPNACPECGPHLTLLDSTGGHIPCAEPIGAAARYLKEGYILAVKGLGGFHLAVDAQNAQAVDRLRMRKHRAEKPFALMAADIAAAESFAHVTPEENALLQSPRRPIVLLKKRFPNRIAGNVAPQNRYFGTMLPYTPLHCLLMARGFSSLVMTSGNLSEEPIAIANHEAVDRLSGIADVFLVHNRDIYIRSDDSIVCSAAGDTRVLRRSRGYVPAPVFLDEDLPQILACGAELKNTVCLTKDSHAFVSQHIGDLENIQALDFYRHTIIHMQRILDIEPAYIAHDMHPDYLSTGYAREFEPGACIAVQHHHAHIVSCMAENHLQDDVIGLALDGTGYGTDGAVWGGEVMIACRAAFQRAAHLAYVPMPGGAAAVREPWRMGISYLMDACGGDLKDLDLRFFDGLNPDHVRLIAEMAEKGVNSPLTSSLGRLFDGVAAIAGIRNRVNFEAQAAMELEMQAVGDLFPLDPGRAYDYEIRQDNGQSFQIPPAPVIRAIVEDLQRGASVRQVSARFHATVIFMFADVCDRIRHATGLQRVVLSGGVFQNVCVLEGMCEVLRARGFSVFTNQFLPANDGGVCLGQAVAAAAQIRKRGFADKKREL